MNGLRIVERPTSGAPQIGSLKRFVVSVKHVCGHVGEQVVWTENEVGALEIGAKLDAIVCPRCRAILQDQTPCTH